MTVAELFASPSYGVVADREINGVLYVGSLVAATMTMQDGTKVVLLSYQQSPGVFATDRLSDPASPLV